MVDGILKVRIQPGFTFYAFADSGLHRFLSEYRTLKSKIDNLQESVIESKGNTENAQQQKALLRQIIDLYIEKDKLTAKMISHEGEGLNQ